MSSPADSDQSAGWAARLRALRAKLGTTDAVLYLVDRALRAASGGRAWLVRYRIVAQPIGRAGAPRLRPDPSTELALAAPDSPLLRHFPRPAPVIQRRFDSGGHCMSAVVKGDFAGYIWWQHERYEEDEVRCSFVLASPGTCVWDYDVYVEPRYRLGRTMARLWQAVDDHLAAQGIAWTLSRIATFNPASLAAHARLGTETCATASFLVLGPVQLAFLGQAPFVHLSWHDGQRPQLRLGPP
ncbi:GNAT family N-acetyltransferase [Aquabacterium humicola]|uniref:GNAT family N-acetyltransferase n=1 Tax=Aquabacterium humicola TaxID=3237377 RepID=UPI002543C0C5|nr:GNAT family N-acetyltransferase [Rubrivivax pictus]